MARTIVVDIVGNASSLERAFARAAGGAKTFDREIKGSLRGVVSGTGLMKGFGRSLAFASGGYLAFRGVSSFLTDSIGAARDAAVSQRQLAAQMSANGESFAAAKKRIDEAGLSLQRFGFTSIDSEKALTVLDRATGNIRRSIDLQGLSANIARAKNLDLASAAAIVAKALSGQTTALRRAVPGLDKHAKGLALIAEAEQKMRGQAAASTTVSEQFAATLHDTERIVGEALLPTVNRYLQSLGKWLQRMQESGKLSHDVHQAMTIIGDGFKLVKGALDLLNSVTGSTKNSIELLVAAFAAFKTAEFVAKFTNISTAIGGIGTSAKKTGSEVDATKGKLLGLNEITIAAITIPIVYAITTKVLKATGAYGFLEGPKGPGAQLARGLGLLGIGANPNTAVTAPGLHAAALAAQRMFRAGYSTDQIQAALESQGIASSDAQKLALGASTPGGAGGFSAGAASLRAQQTALARQRAAAAAAKVPTPPTTPTPGPGASVALRNRWFDATVTRQLDRVQDLSLKNQLTRLKQIADEVKKRIGDTTDPTRRLNLEDQLVTILRDEKSVRGQITGEIQKQNAAIDAQNRKLQQTADTIKSDVLARLQTKQTGITDVQAVTDARAALRTARALGGPQGIKLAQRALEAATFQRRYDILSNAPARLRKTAGGETFALGTSITINVHGTESPAEVARQVVAIIQRRDRHTSVSPRGPGAGTPAGQH